MGSSAASPLCGQELKRKNIEKEESSRTLGNLEQIDESNLDEKFHTGQVDLNPKIESKEDDNYSCNSGVNIEITENCYRYYRTSLF